MSPPRLLATSIALCTMACGSPAPSTPGTVDALLDAMTELPLPGDEVAVDTGPLEDASEIDDTSAAPDYLEDYVPGPGEYLYPCEENIDCNSGYCIDSPDGKVCTKPCDEFCDVAGWECRQDPSAGGVLFLCQPAYATLCDPCRSNDDCVTATDSTPHRCVPIGDAGAFCAGVCSDTAPCPEGFVCSTVVDVEGGVSSQCVPEGALSCSCSPWAVARELSTECSVTGAGGQCKGQRQCLSDGSLSVCDALEPQQEVCNGADDNCNGLTDENFEPEPCPQTNAFGTCEGVTVCDGVQGESCSAATPAMEVCDGIDNNCDGDTDPPGTDGCTAYLRDADNDGYGTADDQACLCQPTAPYVATQAGDCDDGKQQVNPGATEACNGLDDDCDGLTDSVSDGGNVAGCVEFHADSDNDGFGDPNDSQCLCIPSAPYVTTDDSDCAPGETLTSPAAAEVCDAIDNDCDGLTDEDGAAGCTIFFADADEDTYGDTDVFACLCEPSAPYTATQGGDCDDGNGALNPGQTEVCGDQADNDCDGQVDNENAQGCTTYYLDTDGDGFGIIGDARCLCAPDGDYDTTQAGDCDDGQGAVNTEAAEVCDGVDNDCNGVIDDEGTTGCTPYYLDSDGDGFGTGEPLCLCNALGAFNATVAGDCNDGDPSANTSKTEICNGKDDDCDGQTDEPDALGCSVFFTDADEDTFGVAGSGTCLCEATGTSTATKVGDCDDALKSVNPSTLEVCDAVDNDCDGAVDEGCGLPTTGWPTAGYDSRRTGHTMLYDVPTSTPSLAWSTTVPQTGWSMRNSPVIAPGGDVVVSAGDGLYRLDGANGDITRSAQLPASIFPYAGPTLRTGGTVVVGAGSRLLMYTETLEVVWDTNLGSALVSTPMIDPNGNIYVVSETALHRVAPDGMEQWAEPVVNDANTPSHPAIGINGRVYFTTSDHRVYAIDPSKPDGERVVFAVQPAAAAVAEPVHGSVVLSEIATVYTALGNTIYGLSIAGTPLFERTLPTVTRAGLAIHNTGFQCCNPIEYLWYSAAGNEPLFRSGIDLVGSGATGDIAKSASARTSTPVFDRDGDVVLGTASGIRALRQGTGSYWSWQPPGVGTVSGSVALGAGTVVFGDSNATVYKGE